MEKNSIISVQNISFSYDAVEIFKNFSADFERESFTCILGESGSGKSTLLRLINGLLIPQNGLVKIDSEVLTAENLIQKRLEMGYVLQGNSLFPHLTVYQNMIYCLKLLKKSDLYCQEKITELLHLVGLKNDLLQKFPDEISGGQKQRVGIIRAIAHSPKIVLMDEPFSALDSETRDKLQILVKDIHQKLKTTFVMVTHSKEEAKILATNVLEL
ncbi:ATP-binding cassette domain-containing protein [Kaistella flava (ex Peng et al. 2021)]|uniref:ATP-binding cassette domain-containing protein n=1 Tax=Kaistella flava (ex Peng et al. 2021) TaxID=2038776 RepID=A0A7M2Y6U0_9FLAO|nr:ATP-binding cassette domain-containing protein [Kaistella flava (ex Peng et al. 2021)]QOW09142.1 ATP-binding cassette domain-containing protein [Kaistella flava (ex Peng et al. 2021)]